MVHVRTTPLLAGLALPLETHGNWCVLILRTTVYNKETLVLNKAETQSGTRSVLETRSRVLMTLYVCSVS